MRDWSVFRSGRQSSEDAHLVPQSDPPEAGRCQPVPVGIREGADTLHFVSWRPQPQSQETSTARCGPFRMARLPRLAAFTEYDVVALPVLEVYHTTRVSVRFALNHTDICLPMRRKSVT